jgi:tetratricopeptide (TPR) repeat protein
MTLFTWVRSRYFPALPPPRPRFFDVAPDARVLALCHWQDRPWEHPTLLLMHGLEGSSGAHYMLGIALKQSGDLDGALTELKESVRLDPTTPGPYNTMGQILRTKGDKQASEEAFQTGARLKREKESELAERMRTRRFGTRVFKAPRRFTKLRQAVRAHRVAVREMVRAKNRLKPGLQTRGDTHRAIDG